ncbi:hypothetical protein [Amphritea japonica]|uniref:hypothetical protein n=1 Tax=Amphritea japonica TaxID=452627 RepID=UPI0012EA043A|nr:hypothetical protein [Amphritea japonica]
MISNDAENKVLINRFPILTEQLNPYGTMQGGVVSAIVDNTQWSTEYAGFTPLILPAIWK